MPKIPDQAKAKLSARQILLIRHLLKGMTLTEAGKAAGYSEEWAYDGAKQALESIQAKMPEVLQRHGLTKDSLTRKYLLPALEAKESKFAQKDGEFTDERELIAWGPRLTALEMAYTLAGAYPKTGMNGDAIVNVQINTNVQVPEP